MVRTSASRSRRRVTRRRASSRRVCVAARRAFGGVELGWASARRPSRIATSREALRSSSPEPRGGARQRALLRLAGADAVAQRALALPARGRGRDEGGQQDDDERDGGAGHGELCRTVAAGVTLAPRAQKSAS